MSERDLRPVRHKEKIEFDGIGEVGVIDLFRRYAGSVKDVAEYLDVSTRLMYEYLRDHPEVAQARNEAQMELLDEIANVAYKMALEGDGQMIRFLLGRRHPDFKRTTGVEVTASWGEFVSKVMGGGVIENYTGYSKVEDEEEGEEDDSENGGAE